MRTTSARPADGIEDLVYTYGNMLFGICFTMLGNESDAEDAVQDIFIKIIGKLPEFEEPAQEKAWLTRVLVNHCRDQLRKRKLRLYTPLDELLE